MNRRLIAILAFCFAIGLLAIPVLLVTPEITGAHFSGPTPLFERVVGLFIGLSLLVAILSCPIALVLILCKKPLGFVFWLVTVGAAAIFGVGIFLRSLDPSWGVHPVEIYTYGASLCIQIVHLFLFQKCPKW